MGFDYTDLFKTSSAIHISPDVSVDECILHSTPQLLLNLFGSNEKRPEEILWPFVCVATATSKK